MSHDPLKPQAPFFTPEMLGKMMAETTAQAPASTGNAQPIAQRDAEQPDAVTALRLLYEAVKMDMENKSVKAHNEGRAWDGTFFLQQLHRGMSAAEQALAAAQQEAAPKDENVSISLDGSTHTRKASEWLALARADLRTPQAPREAQAVSANGWRYEVPTGYRHMGSTCGGCWTIHYNDTGLYVVCGGCAEKRVVDPTFPDPIARPAPEGWVSVSERLPEPRELVIVEGGVGYYWDAINGWYTVTGERWPGKPIQWDVLHWLPLPATPDPRKENP